jgi:hypothetical protein
MLDFLRRLVRGEGQGEQDFTFPWVQQKLLSLLVLVCALSLSLLSTYTRMSSFISSSFILECHNPHMPYADMYYPNAHTCDELSSTRVR